MALWLIVLVVLGFGLAVAFTFLNAVKWERFLFSPRFWRDWTIYHAITSQLPTGRIEPRRFPRPLSEYGYVKLHEDRYGTVWEFPDGPLWERLRKLNQNDSRRSFRLFNACRRMVEVVDPVDGGHVFLCVPMQARTSTGRGAVAWTFDVPTLDYEPAMET